LPKRKVKLAAHGSGLAGHAPVNVSHRLLVFDEKKAEDIFIGPGRIIGNGQALPMSRQGRTEAPDSLRRILDRRHGGFRLLPGLDEGKDHSHRPCVDDRFAIQSSFQGMRTTGMALVPWVASQDPRCLSSI